MNKDFSPSFVAVIPARGGSSGLPGKNLMEVQGMSLIARAVLIAQEIEEIKWIIVSTDDYDIAREAERAGVEGPFMRPAALARADTPMTAVLEHALHWFRSSRTSGNRTCHGVVLLQPTSPMRKAEHVIGAIDLFVRSRLERMEVCGVHTVSLVPQTLFPENLWRYEGKKTFTERAKSGLPIMARRREGSTEGRLYYRNGAAVVLDPDHLGALTLSGGSAIPYVIDKPLVTIDTFFDLQCIEHCGERLEPDPHAIGWESLRNNGGRG